MTQPDPQQPPPADSSHLGTVVAAAAIALALIAVEARVRQDVEDDIRNALIAFSALLVAALATPGVVIKSGAELLGQPAVHAGLLKSIDTAKTGVAASVRSGYAAGTQVALSKVRQDLATQGYQVGDLPELDDNLDMMLHDIDTMFGHGQSDIANRVSDAINGIQGPDANAARTLVVGKAVDAAAAALQQRAAAAAASAVQHGSSDAQQALFNEYQNASGRRLLKRWVTTSITPCGMCEALNGSTVGVNAEFDHTATTVDQDLRPVWRDLLGPPRHPNCRCQLELVTG